MFCFIQPTVNFKCGLSFLLFLPSKTRISFGTLWNLFTQSSRFIQIWGKYYVVLQTGHLIPNELSFKISVLQENAGQNFCVLFLSLSRWGAHSFQQVSLKGSDIICNKKKVTKMPDLGDCLMADATKLTFIRCNMQQNAIHTNVRGTIINFFFQI